MYPASTSSRLGEEVQVAASNRESFLFFIKPYLVTRSNCALRVTGHRATQDFAELTVNAVSPLR